MTVATRLAALVAVLAALATPCGATSPGVYDVGADPDLGFNLISWYNDPNGGTTWPAAIQNMYDAGFREVSVSPVRYVNTVSGVISGTSQQSPPLSHIAAAVTKAKSLGMSVTVNPFVEPAGFSMWRGQYNPTPNTPAWTQFWGAYRSYLVEVADMAQAAGADSMTVGTELKALNGNAGNIVQWDETIDAVDARFQGSLGYAANWDDYNNATLATAIWEHPAIDFMGIDAYFTGSVSNAQADASGAFPNPTFIGQMEAAWDNRLDNAILPYAAGLKGGVGMPVVLTEVGYLPFNRTGRNPQNETGQAVDTAEQRMAFAGLLNAADGRKEDLRAIHVWQWHIPGSDGSKWNIDPTLPANQPNNVDLGQYLASYAQTAVRAFSTDFSFDGVVDGADFLRWQQNFEGPTTNPNTGDATGDSQTNGDDLALWASQFGQGYLSAANSATVPEPASAVLTLAALAAFSVRRRRVC